MFRRTQDRCSKQRSRGFYKKNSFTLIEMMMVLFLLLVVGGAVTIHFQEAIEQARFKGDVRGVKAVFRSVDEAMAVGFDPYLVFEKNGKGLRLVYQEAMGRFKKKTFDFPSLRHVTLNGVEVSSPLFFGAKGALSPKGSLVLFGGKDGMPIELDASIKVLTANDSDYPEWVREICKKKTPGSKQKSEVISS